MQIPPRIIVTNSPSGDSYYTAEPLNCLVNKYPSQEISIFQDLKNQFDYDVTCHICVLYVGKK